MISNYKRRSRLKNEEIRTLKRHTPNTNVKFSFLIFRTFINMIIRDHINKISRKSFSWHLKFQKSIEWDKKALSN